MRREYQNPLYDHAKNRPLSPPPTSLLPIEHPDFSPDMGCKPTVLFPNARKGKRSAATIGEQTGAPAAVRRSPRRKKVIIGDSEGEGGPDSGVADEDEEASIKPRKLDFGLPKNAMGKTKIAPSKAKAKTVSASDDLF